LSLRINDALEVAEKEHDLFYINARHPDAIPNSIALAGFFAKEQGEKALGRACQLLANR
jgi:hypothetical protein